MSINKKVRRERRGRKTKMVQKVKSNRLRLIVSKSNQHTYSKIVDAQGFVLASSSTMDKELRESLNGTAVQRARQVGELLGKRAKANEITQVAFDRSGFKYHGRIKALAEAAREAGLDF